MSRLRLTPAAQADLEAIYDYSLERWGATRAERYILDIRDACAALADGTRVGNAVDDIRPGYHRLVVGSHVVFFKPTVERIDVMRILHGRMDVTRHL